MFHFLATLALVVSTASTVLATPLPPKVDIFVSRNLFRRQQDITPLSAAQVSSFKPFTYFASAGYCHANATISWSCGINCDANPQFQPTATGGDGGSTQFWYVGFDPNHNTVIAAHQGTNPRSFASDLVDADFSMTNLNETLFPGMSSDIEVHNGFAGSHSRSAYDVLAAVEKTLEAHPGASVTMVGHSLGAALALLDAVFLPLHLPTSVSFKIIGYGMPRVGNQAFADYVDAHITSLAGGTGLVRVTNKEDPIPILPGRFLGYHHPSGEIHIEDTETWDKCPGQDNTSDKCIVGAVPNIFDSDKSDHGGLYDGVKIHC